MKIPLPNNWILTFEDNDGADLALKSAKVMKVWVVFRD
jgi:hypothetical protein